MIYGQDAPVALPVADLYDSAMMQMYLGAVRDLYNTAQLEQKEFLKQYGDFYSPFARDNEYWYNNTMGPVQQLMQEAGSRGIDLTRSPEGRALIASTMRNIPYATLAQIKRNAAAGEEYLKNMAELQRQGKYSPELENWDLARQGLPSFEQWDTATMGPWQRKSPITYLTLHDFVAPIVDNTKPGELTREEVEGFGMKFDPRNHYIGVSSEMLKNPLIRNIPGLAGNPIYDYYKDRAKNEIILKSGDPNYTPTESEVLSQFIQDAVDSVPEYLQRPTHKIDEWAMQAEKEAADARNDARKFQYDLKLEGARHTNRMIENAAKPGRGIGNNGSGEQHFMASLFARGISNGATGNATQYMESGDPVSNIVHYSANMPKNAINFGKTQANKAYKDKVTNYHNKYSMPRGVGQDVFLAMQDPEKARRFMGTSVYLRKGDISRLYSDGSVVTNTLGYQGARRFTSRSRFNKIGHDRLVMEPTGDIYTAPFKDGRIKQYVKVSISSTKKNAAGNGEVKDKDLGYMWYEIQRGEQNTPKSIMKNGRRHDVWGKWSSAWDSDYQGSIDEQNEAAMHFLNIKSQDMGQMYDD